MAREMVKTLIQKTSAGSAELSADPLFHPIDLVLNALVSAESQLNPALAKFLELCGKIEAMPIEELALLRAEIAEAIEGGQAEAEQVKGALERLSRALPEPALRVPRGF